MVNIYCSNRFIYPVTQLDASINWEAIIGILALFVSVISLLFSFRQMQIQRIHNYKSVKPIGYIRIGDYESKLFIKIENNGIGPMIIHEIITKNQTKEINSAFYEILTEEFFKRVPWKNYSGAYPGRAILPGQSLELLTLERHNLYDKQPVGQFETDLSELRSALKEVKIKVKYTDIYSREVYYCESSFKEWFDRVYKV